MVGPWNQVLEVKDIATIAALAILEGLLSADNALVLAIMVKHLPKDSQKKALLYGLGGAFVFRFLAILFATVVLKQWWLQALGALYLILVTAKHFFGAAGSVKAKPVQRGFWATVVIVEITDIAFAVDSVLAGITFVGNDQRKIWVVFFGAIVGIVLLRCAASVFIKLLDKYPTLDHVAYLLVGWVGVKLALISGNSWSEADPTRYHIPELAPVLFWTVLLTIAIAGGIFAIRHGDRAAPYTDDETTEESGERTDEYELQEQKK